MISRNRVAIATVMVGVIVVSVFAYYVVSLHLRSAASEHEQRMRLLERNELDIQMDSLKRGVGNRVEFSPYTGHGVDKKIDEILSLTQIEVVTFDRVDLSVNGLRKLALLPKLKCLVIIQCALDDNDLLPLREISSLRQLVLANTSITAASLPTIGSLGQLRHLVLFDDSVSEADLHVTDSAVVQLTQCQSLKTLDVGGAWLAVSKCSILSDVQLRKRLTVRTVERLPPADGFPLPK